MNAQATPGFVERRKSDPLIDDQIDDSLLDEMRTATDEAEKRRLKIMLAMNRNSWQAKSLISDVIAKIDAQDRSFAEHREEIKATLTASSLEYAAHRQEFMIHAANEEKLISNGQTAYKVFVGVATVVVGLGYYILNGHLSELRDEQSANRMQDKVLASQDKEIASIHAELKLLSDAFTRHLIGGRDPAPAAAGQQGIRLPER